MKRIPLLLLLATTCICAGGQNVWSVDMCISYAVQHNHNVRLRELNLDDNKIEKLRNIGSFLPSVNGSINGQYNIGRAINPETNTYTNVSTFYNGYALSASIPLFDGLSRYHNLLAARASVLTSRHGLQAEKDNVAQNVFKAYIDVLYCKGAVAMATEKREESRLLLESTQLMAETGTKGAADVAQMAATYASDDYEVTRQQSLLFSAVMSLKQQMNYPIEDSLDIVDMDCREELSRSYLPVEEEKDDACAYSLGNNPQIKEAEFDLRTARYYYRSSKGALFPALSIGTGISTTYYKQIGNRNTMPFRDQFRNNAGEYVSMSLGIPLFNRMSIISNIRRQRNNVRRAQENLEYRRSELRRLIEQTAVDKGNSHKEMQKMEQKVVADSIAARLTVRKYEEGLASSIDVQTSAVTLLQSKALLLQCRLSYIYQSGILNHYKGQPLWTESSNKRRD